MRCERGLNLLKRGLTLRHTEILPLTLAISDRAMGLVDKHALSDGLRLADAMIAATVIEHTLTLLTGNTRHFAQIQGLRVEHFGP